MKNLLTMVASPVPIVRSVEEDYSTLDHSLPDGRGSESVDDSRSVTEPRASASDVRKRSSVV